jgi:riboflavin kinase/FMN adenylyltransferase
MRVATIGNFDGVHRGHQAILALAGAVAGEGGTVAAVTFEPLPAAVLRPADAPPRLTTAARREALLRAHGATSVVALDPARGLLAQSPREFLEALRGRVAFDAIVEGADFRFGQGRAGSVRTLEEIGAEMGFRCVVAPEFETALSDGHIVSPRSTLIRWLLELGRVADARALLGRPHGVEGRVVRGDQRGRTLGFPTANVESPGMLLPADGVYAGTAHTPLGAFPAAISVGVKPTFAPAARTCEAHLIGFPGGLGEYGWPVRLEFTAWLREQWRFASVEALVEQIRRDVARCA